MNQLNQAKFDIDNTKIPLEVLKRMLLEGKLYLAKTYIILTRHPIFSGHLSKEKLSEFSSILNQSQTTSRRQLAALVDMGFVNKYETVWMAISGNYIAATEGYAVCKLVKYHSDIRALAFAAVISEQLLRKIYERKEGKRTQDYGDGFNVDLSSSYTQSYLKSLGKEYSTQEISKMRKRAQKYNMLGYWRKRTHVKMSVGEYHERKKYEVELETGVFLSKNQSVVKETPAVFTSCLHVYSRGIPNRLKQHAYNVWMMRKRRK